MPKGKLYFYTISTNNPNGPETARLNNEQLNNYLKYGVAQTNEDIAIEAKSRLKNGGDERQPLGYTINVHHVSATVTSFSGSQFQMMTVLCCDDDREETTGTY
jgi:hypothetical protein